MTDQDNDRASVPHNLLRIRRSPKRPSRPAPVANYGIASFIGKHLRSELNANTTPMPIRILLVALRLMGPQKPPPVPSPDDLNGKIVRLPSNPK